MVPSARVDEVMAMIRASGGRVTQSRRLVVERIVDGGEHHVTAPDLVDALRRDDPEFHESTVYRVLERLAELGVLEPVQGHPGATVFHLADQVHRHHHLLCTGCGSLTEVDGALLDPVAARVAADHGFVMAIDTPTTLAGLCAACHAADEAARHRHPDPVGHPATPAAHDHEHGVGHPA